MLLLSYLKAIRVCKFIKRYFVKKKISIVTFTFLIGNIFIFLVPLSAVANLKNVFLLFNHLKAFVLIFIFTFF